MMGNLNCEYRSKNIKLESSVWFNAKKLPHFKKSLWGQIKGGANQRKEGNF